MDILEQSDKTEYHKNIFLIINKIFALRHTWMEQAYLVHYD